jgi:hypothetical protein
MNVPQGLKALFFMEDRPILSLDASQIPKTCVGERSRVVLDNQSAHRVLVHYRKRHRVVEASL